MTSIDKIKAKLAESNPVTNKHINGVDIPLTEDERAEWLDAAAIAIIESALIDIRSYRNGLLSASDWTQIADAPVDGKAWAVYRQALRDLPATIKDPTEPVDWPTPPQ